MRKIIIDGMKREEVTLEQLMNEVTMVQPTEPTFETVMVRPEGWKPGVRCVVCGAPATWIRFPGCPRVFSRDLTPGAGRMLQAHPATCYSPYYLCQKHRRDTAGDTYPVCPFWKDKCTAPLPEQATCPEDGVCEKRPPKTRPKVKKADDKPSVVHTNVVRCPCGREVRLSIGVSVERVEGAKVTDLNVVGGVEYDLACKPFKADLSEDHDGSFENCIVVYLRPKVKK